MLLSQINYCFNWFSNHVTTQTIALSKYISSDEKERKDLAIKLNLRRIIAGGRLFNYCEFAKEMSPEEYAQKVVCKEISDPVLTFQLKNGFKFIKILHNYKRSSILKLCFVYRMDKSIL